jgi:hypothetical protein
MPESPPFDLADTLDLLARTPAVLDAWLRGLGPGWTTGDEGPETWSPHEVLGHLVHGEETDWVARARIIRAHGERRPFTPYDRLAQRQRYADWTLAALLDRFAVLRAGNLAEVRGWSLTAADLDRTGTHPEFGPVSLRQLLATWAAHDLGHLVQVGRVMARRHTAAVGPWRAYLSVLRTDSRGG